MQTILGMAGSHVNKQHPKRPRPMANNPTSPTGDAPMTEADLAEWKRGLEAAPADAKFTKLEMLSVYGEIALLAATITQRDAQLAAWQLNAESYLRENNGLKQRAEAAEAELERLRANQRTPGTVERCRRCKGGSEFWNNCADIQDCPIRAALKSPAAQPGKEG